MKKIILLFMIVLMAGFVSAGWDYTLLFECETNMEDSGPQSVHMTENGTPTYPTGLVGQACNVSDQNVEGNFGSIAPNATFGALMPSIKSVVIWVKSSLDQACSHYYVTDGTGNNRYFYNINANKLFTQLNLGGGGPKWAIDAEGAVNVDEWQLSIVMQNASGTFLHMDGSLTPNASAGGVTDVMSTSFDELFLGTKYGSTDTCTNTLYDEWAFFNYSLSSENMTKIHENGLVGIGFNPVSEVVLQTDVYFANDSYDNHSINFTSDGGESCGYNTSGSWTVCGPTSDTTPTIRGKPLTGDSASFAIFIYGEGNDGHNIITDGRIGEWRFEDGNSTFTPDETGDNDGVVVGATLTEDGWVGNAYKFDGADDNINIGNAYDRPNKEITISTWIKVDKMPDAGNNHDGLVMDVNLGTFSSGYGLNLYDGNKIRFWINIWSSNFAEFTPFTDTTGWHHIAGVYNGTNIYVYVDGVVGGTVDTYSDNIDYTSATGLQFGKGFTGSDNWFNGTMDEVVIFNRSLSAHEVGTLYNNRVARFYNYTELQSVGINYTNCTGTSEITCTPSWYASFEIVTYCVTGQSNGFEQNTIAESKTNCFNISIVDMAAPVFSNVSFFALNSSKDVIGNASFFNVDNLTVIEFMKINGTVTDASSISDNYSLFYTANGTNGCALGNRQSQTCFFTPNFIEVRNNTITTTFDSTVTGGNRGDSIACTLSGTTLSKSFSCIIDEHYNPNIVKHYDALYNFSDIKWQDGLNQRITKNNRIKVHIGETNLPLDANFYKLDLRVNYTVGSVFPVSPLEAYACNSTHTGEDVETYPGCQLVCALNPSDFQDDGTKFRCIFTNTLISNIGDFDHIVLEAHLSNPNQYYYIKTYKATASPYETHWNYSTNSGATWLNLGDGYESELNLNYFYNDSSTSNVTAFVMKARFDDSFGNSDNSTTFEMKWDIGEKNLPPLVSIFNPSDNESIFGVIDVNVTIAEPNGDTYISNVTLTNSSSVNVIGTFNTGINSLLFTTTIFGEGRYNLTWEVCENNTVELYCTNDTIEVVIDNIGTFLHLDGVFANRTYEYRTFVNISSDYRYLTIFDEVGNITTLFFTDYFSYHLNVLRLTLPDVGIASGSSYNISIDNRTDLYRAEFNISGDGITNISLNNGEVKLPGTLYGSSLYQNKFIFNNIVYERFNLSFKSAESKQILINFSSEGNSNRVGNFFLKILGFNVDNGNDFIFNSIFYNINNTDVTKIGTEYPIGGYEINESTWESFANNDTFSRWTGDVTGFTKGGNCNTGRFGGDNTCIFYDQQRVGGIDAAEFYYDYVDVGFLDYVTIQTWLHARCTATSKFVLTDGTNEKIIDTLTEAGCPWYSSGSDRYCNYTMNKTSSTIWNIKSGSASSSGCFDGNLDVSSLDIPYYFKMKALETGCPTCESATQTVLMIKNINYGGIYLNKTNISISGIEGSSGSSHTGNFTTHLLNTTPSNVTGATLVYYAFVPSGTTVTPYLSNDDGVTFEAVSNNTGHLFISEGNNIRARFELTTDNNITTPLIYDYTVSVSSSAMSSLEIDVGSDGDFDFNFDYELNSTSTPVQTDNDSQINNYIFSNCVGDPFCVIPIDLISGSGGILQLELNFTENINPIRLNYTPFQDFNNINISVEFEEGTVLTLEDFAFDYNGSKNITIQVSDINQTSKLNATVYVKYSKFRSALTYDWSDVIIFNAPRTNNSKNVTPYLQTSIKPIYNITGLAYDDNFIIVAKINKTTSCINLTFSNSSDKNDGFILSNSTFLNLSITNSPTDTILGWLWADLSNCNYREFRYFIPEIELRSCCLNCTPVCW